MFKGLGVICLLFGVFVVNENGRKNVFDICNDYFVIVGLILNKDM